jgi:hypothetical protein
LGKSEQEKIMNAMDFSILNSGGMRLSGLIALCLVANIACAEAPSAESFNHHNELVLTLSDHGLPSDNNRLAPSAEAADRQSTNNSKKRPVDVDCGMDTNPLVTYDNSLGNRLQGECNLDYRY